MPNDFAKRVKAYRAANNLTQADLAKRLELSTTAVKSWEHGYRKPSEATQVKFDALLNTAAEPTESTSARKKTKAQKAPPARKQEAVSQAAVPKKAATEKPVSKESSSEPNHETTPAAETIPYKVGVAGNLSPLTQEMIVTAEAFLEWFRSRNIEITATDLIDLVKAATESK